MTALTTEFRHAYAHHRAAEGRAHSGEEMWLLPYLRSGPLARQWAVRAKTFDAFVRHVLTPSPLSQRLNILDLGAGNGWLCHRVAIMGHKAIALDIREDRVDGLGAAAEFLCGMPGLFERVGASFDNLPFAARSFDVTVFNASLHYATDLPKALAEAVRVTRSGGTLAILDSPFYAREADGDAMIAEKRAQGADTFGRRAEVLLSQGFIEYLTSERLCRALPALIWSRHPVRYPLWYEMRPLIARLKVRRTPSRFDLWIARVP